jgi:hypothetical protein
LERGVHAASMFRSQWLLKSTEDITLKRAKARAPVKPCRRLFCQNNKIDIDFNFIELYKTKERFNFIK